MATTGYKIGYEGSDLNLAFLPETEWNVSPDGGGTNWTSVRLSSFSTGYARTRVRPSEIRSDKQQPKGVTTQIACAPTMEAPLTKTAWSPVLAASINGVFSSASAVNGTVFQSFSLLEEFSASETRVISGAWPSGGTLRAEQGQMLRLSFDFLAAGLVSAGAPVDARDPVNTYDIMDPIAGVAVLSWNGVPMGGVTSLTLTWTKQEAAALYVLGAADAAGIAMGSLQVDASATLYFNDQSLFAAMVAETEGALVLGVRDGTEGYDFTVPAATIVSHDDPVSGSGPISATVNFEGAPGPAGHTIQIDEIGP